MVWNQWINHIRVRVENAICRITYKFRCLSLFWRHDVHAHAEAFLCAAQIAALDIKHHPMKFSPALSLSARNNSGIGHLHELSMCFC